jgi:hypothetical protein
MSQGNFNAPPPAKSGGGMSTMMIVLIVLGVLGLICIGACGACYYGAQSLVTAAGGMVFAETSMVFIKEDEAVKAELGDPLTQENAKFKMEGNKIVVDFDVKGPNGTGKGHAEFAGDNSNPPPGQPPKPGTIKVTLPSGKVVDVSTAPKVEFQNQPSDVPEESGDTDAIDTDATPDDSTDM